MVWYGMVWYGMASPISFFLTPKKKSGFGDASKTAAGLVRRPGGPFQKCTRRGGDGAVGVRKEK
jgi:hypothetical protein